jgi:hypothetical protein
MPNPSQPCRPTTPETALQPFQGHAGDLQLSSTLLDTPRHTTMGDDKKLNEADPSLELELTCVESNFADHHPSGSHFEFDFEELGQAVVEFDVDGARKLHHAVGGVDVRHVFWAKGKSLH